MGTKRAFEDEGLTGVSRAVRLLTAALLFAVPMAALACTDVFGGAGSYDISGNSVFMDITDVTNISLSSTTGTLRLELWMFSSPYSFGSGQTGYKVAEYSMGQLGTNSDFPTASATVPLLTVPADGDYYAYFLLTEFTQNCGSSDGYCVDWFNGFPDLAIVSGGVFNGSITGAGDASSGPAECVINPITGATGGKGAFSWLLFPVLLVFVLTRWTWAPSRRAGAPRPQSRVGASDRSAGLRPRRGALPRGP